MKTIQTLKDVLTMSGRCLLLSKRNPDTILTSIIAPILTMLLFAYVIGGAMQTGETSYVNFIVPGMVQKRYHGDCRLFGYKKRNHGALLHHAC